MNVGITKERPSDEARLYLAAVADGVWPCDSGYIPEDIRDSLIRYVKHGLRTGGFLEAVLSNDLMDAYRRADRENLIMMPAIIAWIYSHVPTGAHGSRATYQRWLDEHPESIARRKSVDIVNSET